MKNKNINARTYAQKKLDKKKGNNLYVWEVLLINLPGCAFQSEKLRSVILKYRLE